ncbi:hypothetical protein EGR_10584 [Echinococcus granulosus]|uniref:Uncharacterized protein n=1 Tax=Echinococcus granulosus TaxID=6210 RepID=W6U0K4_ECHGR|nr:hypothetical protein EGR_10584 [Echinococcus granulosus]EUB54558.1 hypothetical protein EGR_10584 [Echinococcus granulosus]
MSYVKDDSIPHLVVLYSKHIIHVNRRLSCFANFQQNDVLVDVSTTETIRGGSSSTSSSPCSIEGDMDSSCSSEGTITPHR